MFFICPVEPSVIILVVPLGRVLSSVVFVSKSISTVSISSLVSTFASIVVCGVGVS